MKMTRCQNGLWKCRVNNLEFFVPTISEVIAIAWRIGGRV